jgi:hypothetical protein
MPRLEDQPADVAPEAAEAQDTARRTLALRIAQRNRLREMRAERLARLRPPVLPAPAAATTPAEAEAADAAAALEEFLRALTGEAPAFVPAPAPPSTPGAVLHFQRPGPSAPVAVPPAAAPCDLGQLPGAGPGLVGALRRAGLADLAALAPLSPGDLVARLGPLGRLVPAAAWIAVARSAGSAEASR